MPPGLRRHARRATSASRRARSTRASARPSSVGAIAARAARLGRRSTPVGRPPATDTARQGSLVSSWRCRRRIARPGQRLDRRLPLLPPRPELASDAFVTSARIAPGASSLVRHVILYRIAPGSVAEALRLDSRSPATAGRARRARVEGGTSAARGFLDDAGWIAAWAPGWGADRLRAGTGVELPAGSRIVMRVHYNLLNGVRPDRSRAVLTTVPATHDLTPVQTLLLPAPSSSACRANENGRLCDRTAAVFDQVDRFGTDSALVSSGLLLLCGKDAARRSRAPCRACERRVGRRSRSRRSPATCISWDARSASSSPPAPRARGSCSRSRAGASTGRRRTRWNDRSRPSRETCCASRAGTTRRSVAARRVLLGRGDERRDVPRARPGDAPVAIARCGSARLADVPGACRARARNVRGGPPSRRSRPAGTRSRARSSTIAADGPGTRGSPATSPRLHAGSAPT